MNYQEEIKKLIDELKDEKILKFIYELLIRL